MTDTDFKRIAAKLKHHREFFQTWNDDAKLICGTYNKRIDYTSRGLDNILPRARDLLRIINSCLNIISFNVTFI